MTPPRRRFKNPRRFTFVMENDEMRLLKHRAVERDVTLGELLRSIIRGWLGLPDPGESDASVDAKGGR